MCVCVVPRSVRISPIIGQIPSSSCLGRHLLQDEHTKKLFSRVRENKIAEELWGSGERRHRATKRPCYLLDNGGWWLCAPVAKLPPLPPNHIAPSPSHAFSLPHSLTISEICSRGMQGYTTVQLPNGLCRRCTNQPSHLAHSLFCSPRGRHLGRCVVQEC
jgi:hypothetical protein